MRDWHREDMNDLEQRIENHFNGLRRWMITMSFVIALSIGLNLAVLGVVITSLDDDNPVAIKNYYAAPPPVATAPATPSAD